MNYPPNLGGIRQNSGGRRGMVGTLSGRPSYASLAGTAATLRREESFQLLRQMRKNVPIFKRTTEILAGFVGTPQLVVPGSKAATEALALWSKNVELGDGVGQGIASFLEDAIGQALTYGYCVGETEIGARRDGVRRLWTYDSCSIGFRSDADGGIVVEQATGLGVAKALNPATMLRMTHGPVACNPNGESKFSAVLNHCQHLLDVHHANHQTWRRNGIPIYHVHYEPSPQEVLEDPSGSETGAIRDEIEAHWNAAMKSQDVDGRAKDFFSAGGKTTVTVIGADGAVMDIEVNNKVLLELIISATGIPPFMFGLSWATTERMSKQQMDAFTQTAEAIRRMCGGAVQKAADLHVRLSGMRQAVGFTLQWPDLNLLELEATARAAQMDAAAAVSREKVGKALWQAGVFNQQRYGAYVLAEEPEEVEIAKAMAEPPQPEPAPGMGAQPGTPNEQRALRSEEGQREMRAEYPTLWRDCRGCKASADDPVQLWGDEEPQYPALRREVERAWEATTAAYLEMREEWFAALGEADPGKGAKAISLPDFKRVLKNAADRFLRLFRGRHSEKEELTAPDTEDGVLQQAVTLGYAAGTGRGQEQAPGTPPALTEFIRRRLLEDTYARLSDGSRLRFEARLDEIRAEMVRAIERGDNPLTVARKMGKDLDGYWAGRLRTIVRTEMAFASEQGILDHGEAHGVTLWDVIGNPNTDALCVGAQRGGPYTTQQMRGKLPLHPNCFDSAVAHKQEQER